MSRLFNIYVRDFDENGDFYINTVSSINFPKDNSLMFVMKKCINQIGSLKSVKECLVFWPEEENVPSDLNQHIFIPCQDPRIEYSKFLINHSVSLVPQQDTGKYVNGAFIGDEAKIGSDVITLPFSYISGQAVIGNNVYIGSGAKIMGKVKIGDNVIIRENTVIGVDGLSTDRDEEGLAVTMPQLGGVVIGDNVQIGASTVIARGAIDDTIICQGCKIDNSCFISHNVYLGENTFVVGESIMFGSSRTGSGAYISGNSTVRNGICIGKNAFVGMGGVVVRDVPDGVIVKGNPAK